MGTVLPNSQCAMGALPSNHRITITDLFSWISLHLKGIHTLWVVAKVLVTASSFHRPSGMLHTLRQVIDQDWMQQSSVSIYNLSAAYVCHSNQLHMLQFTIETKLNMAIYQHSVGSLNLKKRKTTFQHMLPHQSKFFFASLSSQNNIKNKNWVRKMTRCSSISSAIWGAFAGGLPTEATLPWKQTHTLENLKKIL